MSSFRVFGVFRGSLLFGDKSEYVVAAPQYRAAANTAMGWKNSNLRTEMIRLLRRAGVSGWPRLFHSMRASRQTELQREFPLHVVCSWLGKQRIFHPGTIASNFFGESKQLFRDLIPGVDQRREIHSRKPDRTVAKRTS